MTKICIIGGGASGMMTAISIALNNPLIDITIIEKKEKLGSKLYATGNGRCNITNMNCETFGQTCKVFRNIGVEIKVTDEGRAYPVSEQAKDVVFALETAIKSYGINVMVNHVVTDIKLKKNGKYLVLVDKKEMEFDIVVLATGGKSAAHFGTTGEGYKFATNLGHKVNKLIPALVPIECTNQVIGNASGVRAKAKATLKRNGEKIDEQVGEIQFIKDGLSGIAIFNMSSHVRLLKGINFNSYSIILDLIAQYKDAEILYILALRKNIKDLKTVDLFNAIVNSQIASRLLKEVGNVKANACDLTDEDLKNIVDIFRNVTFTVTGVKGWKEAQCTAGGVDFDQFDVDTMQSKICKGLYFVGEIIDYDGPCGGYNLENAWVTARKAGKAICTEYMK